MDKTDAGALFDRVVNLYRGQVWLPEDRVWGYPLLAAVTLATHHAGQVSHWFILNLEGATASGKGEVAKVLRRGPVVLSRGLRAHVGDRSVGCAL